MKTTHICAMIAALIALPSAHADVDIACDGGAPIYGDGAQIGDAPSSIFTPSHHGTGCYTGSFYEGDSDLYGAFLTASGTFYFEPAPGTCAEYYLFTPPYSYGLACELVTVEVGSGNLTWITNGADDSTYYGFGVL